jgi:hypothetical protein
MVTEDSANAAAVPGSSESRAPTVNRPIRPSSVTPPRSSAPVRRIGERNGPNAFPGPKVAPT